jgi:glutamate-1-semialdehyde 2,1-aminomutase
MKFDKSKAIQERARKRIPGMTQLLSKRPDRFSQGVWPAYYDKSKGCEVWDLDGNHYRDMSISGIGACILGYADPDVDAAVTEAIRKGVASSLNCPEEVELAELLCELHPWADMARFTRSGGEAMAVAVRIARAHTGRDVVAFCGYHGWQDWYLAANLGTENALGEHLISGLKPKGVPKALTGTALPFRFNHLEELQAIVDAHGDSLGVIVIEPIRSTRPEPGFFEGIRAIADKTGAVLIIDEISAGFRFCCGGSHLELFDQTPDMAVFSKAMGNGYPISAVIGTEKVMQSAQDTFISSTNWTERTGFAAALATIRKHRELGVHHRLGELGRAVMAGWKKAADKHGLAIRIEGLDPFPHFDLGKKDPLILKALFVQLMLEQGFLASNLYYAMFAHSDENVRQYIQAVDTAFGTIAKAIEAGNYASMIKGEPAMAGFGRLA